MPSSMPHLLLAHRYQPLADPLFFIGSLAPDSVTERGLKDRLHLRNADNREAALIALASRTDPTHPFAEGILLHLFLDWKWDKGPQADFAQHYGADWFLAYRAEISLLTVCLFHHFAWSQSLWDAMLAVESGAYPPMSDYTFAEIHAMIARNRSIHRETAAAAPGFYVPDAVIRFIDNVKDDYVRWRKDNGYAGKRQ